MGMYNHPAIYPSGQSLPWFPTCHLHAAPKGTLFWKKKSYYVLVL